MRPRALFACVFGAALAARLCHVDILWVEECYPAAAALQILDGKVPYRDFWFDKPPLSALAYVLWDVRKGWLLRLAGAIFVTLASWILYRFARKWGEREGAYAACLTAFFLTFGVPSAVMALAPDLLMLAPHAGAVYLAARGRPFWSGVVAGVAMLIHAKGWFVLAGCLAWQARALPAVAAGFVLPNALMLAWLAGAGALGAYWEQVWRWGVLYSRDTFVEAPATEGLRRTLNWAGMHGALVVGAAWFYLRERSGGRWRFAVWTLVSLAAIAAGWRFFPRYYFHLLPVMTLAAARGLSLAGRKGAIAALALLLIPAARFGPRYVELAADLVHDRPHKWKDVAMYEGSREAARTIDRLARSGDTLFVWGYRPDIYVETRLAAGTPFLDSQPLTGVIADRHLVDARVSAPGLAAANRRKLVRTRPTFVVDGLGPYNPKLAITEYPDLREWLAGYEEAAQLPTAVVYRSIALH
ncbi:MAG: glycosyltransferase family 39 protein [Bryobacteraceae bacterium]|nr:glycosyltransferase family 39 protein [Bryobacteraceae bacterium]